MTGQMCQMYLYNTIQINTFFIVSFKLIDYLTEHSKTFMLSYLEKNNKQ